MTHLEEREEIKKVIQDLIDRLAPWVELADKDDFRQADVDAIKAGQKLLKKL